MAGAPHIQDHLNLESVPDLYHRASNIDVGPLIDLLPPLLHRHFLGLELWQYAGFLSFLMVAVLWGRLGGKVLEWVSHRILNTRQYSWGDKLGVTLHHQLQLLMGGWLFHATLPLLKFPTLAHNAMDTASHTFMALAVVWTMYGGTNVVTVYLRGKAARTETRLDDQLVPLVDRLMKIAVALIGLLIVLQSLDVNIGSLLAGLGIGGVAFALAAQSTLANLLGSITIFLDRPFQIGDWIRSGEIDGVVELVGFRSTRIRTWENSVITVPNAKLVDSVVNNLGVRPWRRSRNILAVTYSTTPAQLEALVEGLRAILQAHPRVRKDLYDVHFFKFGDHSLDILFQFHIDANTLTSEWQTQHEVFLEVLRLATALKVDFAFPTQTLHIANMGGVSGEAREVAPSPQDLSSRIMAFGPGGELSRIQNYELTHGFHPRVMGDKGTDGDKN